MGKKKAGYREWTVCFDNVSLRKLVKMMDEKGIGSLCRQLMERAAGNGCEETARGKGAAETQKDVKGGSK